MSLWRKMAQNGPKWPKRAILLPFGPLLGPLFWAQMDLAVCGVGFGPFWPKWPKVACGSCARSHNVQLRRLGFSRLWSGFWPILVKKGQKWPPKSGPKWLKTRVLACFDTLFEAFILAQMDLAVCGVQFGHFWPKWPKCLVAPVPGATMSKAVLSDSMPR